jgi:hypothetical protein
VAIQQFSTKPDMGAAYMNKKNQYNETLAYIEI